MKMPSHENGKPDFNMIVKGGKFKGIPWMVSVFAARDGKQILSLQDHDEAKW